MERYLPYYYLGSSPASVLMIGSSQSATAFLQFCEERQAMTLSLLRQMVEIESPSDDKAAVDSLGACLVQELERRGGKVRVHHQESYGNHLEAEFPGRAGAKPVLLLGHFDTVWPLGTLAKMPFHVQDGRAFGPGVLDMKAGLVMILLALDALRELNCEHRPVVVLLDTDEEVGTISARPIVEAVAGKCEAVLVVEPAQGLEGDLKTARKGVGGYTIRVRGRAAHAGVDFEKGHSAVLELARQLLEVAKFTDLGRGITVNPGVIRGGTRTNVVAAEASVDIDVRVALTADARELEQKFAALRSFDSECSLEIRGGLNRPPMERTEGTVRLFNIAREQAVKIGMMLREAATGGGSDGNFTSAMGIPTLDGLGAVGEGAHAAHESIRLEELPRRAALLASLLENL